MHGDEPHSPAMPRESPSQAHAAKPSGSVVVAFGPYKGKTPSELTDDQLSETIDLAHQKLMEEPKAKWAKAMRENLGALEYETELRMKAPRQPSAEPTSNPDEPF